MNEPDAELIRRALGGCEMLCSWPADALYALAASARLERYDRRATIERQRREALVVVSGRLEVEVVDAAGARFVIHIVGPGEITCLLRMLDDPPFVYSCLVHEGTVLVHLPVDAVQAVLNEHPLLWRGLCLLMMQRLHGQMVRQQRRAFGQIDSHVADLLLELARTQGRPGDDGLLGLRLSQSDIAAMLAVSRQTVNKELRALAQRGLIDVDYGRITLRDLDELKRIAERDCE
ncbi:MAG: Crp/Fnr family transcriptional regulator [Acidovorax sp.]